MVLEGKTYLLTRCTVLQYLLFRPDPDVTNLIFFALGVAARECGIQLHALCAMSDHIHMVITDADGCHPKFTHRFHLLVSRGVKRLRQWQGEVFEGKQSSLVELITREAIIEKIAYVLANPVEAGLVQYARQWPGAKTTVNDMGCGVIRAKRPNFYFNPKNKKWPAYVDIPITLPPGLQKEEVPGFREAVAAKLEHLEKAAQARMKQERRRFLGAESAMRISHLQQASKEKPQQQIDPKFAVGRNKPEARKKATNERRAFLDNYRIALDQWRSGDRGALFPEGTWWMRVFFGARTTTDGDPPVALQPKPPPDMCGLG